MESAFQYRQYFWLFTAIGILIILFLFYIRWKNDKVKRLGNARLVRQLIRNYSPFIFTLKFILIIIAFSLGILAAANLRKPSKSAGIERKGIDIVIALDISRSMLAEDVAPNRLARAKQIALKLLDKLPNDRFALVVFAAQAYMQMPLTTDHGSAALFITTAIPEAISQGTSFSEALRKGMDMYDAEEKYKTVIFLSDGENHDETALETAEELSKQGVVVYSVGIGTTQGERIPEAATRGFKRDASGKIVVTKLVEPELVGIAEKTNGAYIYGQDIQQTVDALVIELSKMEKKTILDISSLNYTTFYVWFALPMLLLLILELFIPDKKKLKHS